MSFKNISFTDQIGIKLLLNLFMRIFFNHLFHADIISAVVNSVFVVLLKLVEDLLFLDFVFILIEPSPFGLLLFKELFVSVLKEVIEYVCSFLQVKSVVNQGQSIGKIENVSSRIDQNIV